MVRENTKKTFMFVTPVVLILLLSVVTPGFVHAEEVDTEENDYIIRAPIRIDGNDDFAAQGAAEGWPGDGSEGDPYVIEGYEINGTGHGYGIYVGNTTVHFVVRGCYVHNASGVEVDYDKGVPIEKAVYNSGIILFNVQNSKLENNSIFDNSRTGIFLYKVKNGLLNNNTVSNSRNAIRLSNSESVYVYNNKINNHLGISVSNSSNNNVIINNYIRGSNNTVGFGIGLRSSNNNINNNTISNYRYGISADAEHYNIIEDNTFLNIGEEDIFMEYGPEENGDKDSDHTSFMSFSFTVIAIMIAALTIWIKKDKLKELKK